MISEWTSHLKEEDKKFFERQVKGAKPVLERLDQLLDKRAISIENAEFSIKSFDSPSWAHKQAYMNGYKAALKTTRKYLDLEGNNG